MSSRPSLRLTITLAVVMIVLLVALTVGWVLLTAREVIDGTRSPGLYWTLLAVGTVFLILVLVGVVMYLTLTIKAINLNQRQSNFIDSVTHELKSPIASLKLYLQTLNRRPVEPGQAADFYRFMLDDVERLDRLINHLLDAARVDHDTSAGDASEVELAPTLERCAEMACARYHVPLDTVRISGPPAIVVGRPVDVELVLRNLLDNAVKYAGSPPEVTVLVAADAEGRVKIEIGDNGRGIPMALRRQVFGRFARLGRELERDKPGTGLGLYITRTLVGRMRGRIQVRDRVPAPGTVFEVTLPGELHVESPIGAATDAAAAIVKSNASAATALAEDRADAARVS